MDYRRILGGMVLVSVLSSCTESEKTKPIAEDPTPSLVGTWRSFERGGSDSDDSIVAITEAYNADGTCKLVGHLRWTKAKTFERSYTGTYRLLPGWIVVRLTDFEEAARPYTLTDGTLTIFDPELDSWFRYKKDK